MRHRQRSPAMQAPAAVSETGKGGGLKSHCPKGLVGSSPTRRIRPRRRSAARAIIPRPWTPPPAWKLIRELCSFEGRLAGTDAERRAGELARRAAARRRAAASRSSRPTSTPSTRSSTPRTALLGFAGSLVAIVQPAGRLRDRPGRAPSRCTSTSTPASTCCAGCSSAAPRRTSSPPARGPTRPRACSSAPTTTPPAPAPSSARATIARFARLAAALPLPLGPFRLLFWSLAPLLPILGARMAGVDSSLLSRPPAHPHPDPPRRRLPARRHRALRRRARRQRQRLRRRDRALARRGARREPARATSTSGSSSTGAEECLHGGHALLRPRPPQASSTARRTYFLNLDSVGRGDVRYETSEGLRVSFAMDRRLVELCDAIADRRAPRTATATGAEPAGPRARRATPCRRGSRGFRATTITAIERRSAPARRLPPPRRHSRARSTRTRSTAPTRFALRPGAGARPRRRPPARAGDISGRWRAATANAAARRAPLGALARRASSAPR